MTIFKDSWSHSCCSMTSTLWALYTDVVTYLPLHSAHDNEKWWDSATYWWSMTGPIFCSVLATLNRTLATGSVAIFNTVGISSLTVWSGPQTSANNYTHHSHNDDLQLFHSSIAIHSPLIALYHQKSEQILNGTSAQLGYRQCVRGITPYACCTNSQLYLIHVGSHWKIQDIRHVKNTVDTETKHSQEKQTTQNTAK